jgi:hypothetical protein
MTPVASRNVVNILIFVGLSPILLWLFLLALSALYPEGFLPWVSAGIIFFGAPLGLLSVLIALPVMLIARNRAAENPAVWTRFHRLPFFFGVAIFVVDAIAGIFLVRINLGGQPESIKIVAAFEVPLPSQPDRDQFLSVLRAAAEAQGMHLDAASNSSREMTSRDVPATAMTLDTAVWRGARDSEPIASAMDRGHVGQVWIIFFKGKDPALASGFREGAMHEILRRWPDTRSLPIVHSRTIPLRSDLIRTDNGYIVNPSAANRYSADGTEGQPRAR